MKRPYEYSDMATVVCTLPCRLCVGSGLLEPNHERLHHARRSCSVDASARRTFLLKGGKLGSWPSLEENKRGTLPRYRDRVECVPVGGTLKHETKPGRGITSGGP